MYVLARDLTRNGKTFPKGTRLSDVYDGGPDGTFYAMAPYHGTRVKLLLRPDDLATRSAKDGSQP